MPIPDSHPLSYRAYGRHRKALGLVGDSHTAVRRAVDVGRLVASVGTDAKGQKVILDAALADREWAANTDYSDAPASVVERVAPAPAVEEDDDPGAPPQSAQEGMSLSEANAVFAVWKAKTAELKYREAAAELLDARVVEREWADILSHVRTRLLAIPTYMKQAAPHLTVADVAIVEQQIRDALEELSGG